MSQILVLGHGWYMMKHNIEPRCAPLTIQEWNAMVRDVPEENITFMDMCTSQEPDIVANVGNDWKNHSELLNGTFDYIVDSISHIAGDFRRSLHYWNGVKHCLKENGVYIGWDDNPQRKGQCVRIHKHDLDTYVSTTYGTLKKPKKPFVTI